MVKMINVTIPDDIHALLKKIKVEKDFPNNAEAIVWTNKKTAGVERQIGKIRKAVEKNQNLRSWRYRISSISRRCCRLDFEGTKIFSYISAPTGNVLVGDSLSN